MKNFDDFRASLTEDDISAIAKKPQNVLDEARDELSTNPKANFGNRNHEWLQQDS